MRRSMHMIYIYIWGDTSMRVGDTSMREEDERYRQELIYMYVYNNYHKLTIQ